MMNEFVTAEFLGTFAGLVVGTGIVVELVKYLLGKKLTDAMVRPVAFIVAVLLTFIFTGDTSTVPGIVLTILNAFLITLAASGAYDYISDPKAEKHK